METLTNSPQKCEQTRKSTRGKMRNVDRAYLAGFIDGEGSIGLYSTNHPKQQKMGWSPSFFSRIMVGNTNPEIPKFLKEHYGGWLGLERRKFYGRDVLPIYRYNASGKICDHILRDIVPYLKQKKERAKMLIHYYQNRKKLSWNTKEKIRMQFVELNGNSRKSHHPQRLNEKTPYSRERFQNNSLIRRSESPNLREIVSQT